MDIAGAKALKKRLGQNGADETPPARATVSEGAPPVYHWLGVSQPAAKTPSDNDEEEELAAGGSSLFQRLGLGFR